MDPTSGGNLRLDQNGINCYMSTTRVRYNTCLLSDEPYRAKFCDAVSEALPEINTNASASERWSSVENIVKEAAESTIGLTAPTGRRDTSHCPEMAAMSAEQRKLKLWRQNTRDVNNKAILKLQRNAILHAMRRKSRSNTEERLDRMASEVERLHDGAKMFRAVREMTRRPSTQLTFHDDAGRIISNSTEINTQFSIIYFRGLGLKIMVRVWVRVRVRVWVRVRVRVSVVL